MTLLTKNLRTMKFKVFICVLCSIAWTSAHAQSFRWKADLEKVPSNGFYKIALTPELIAKTANSDLADIRIYEKQKEIAYLVRQLPDSIYAKDTTAVNFQHYTAVPSPAISTKEDGANKRTIVTLTFKAQYQIDKLALNLKGFRYYRRTAWLSEVNPLIRNNKNRYSADKLVNFIISSEKQPVIELYGANRYKQLFLVIENEDNSPLLIKNIEAFQKNIELIAYLERSKQYVIKTGQPKLGIPNYDLSYFSDRIGNKIPSVKVLDFKMSEKETLEKGSTFIKKGWMWAAIGILIVFLGYISYFMVKDLQRKKQAH